MGALLGLMPLISTILDRVLPDPEAKAKAMSEIMNMAAQGDIAQLEVNKAEASNASIFVAGWRPFIGWVCGFAVAYTFLLLPLGMFVASFIDEKYVTVLLNAPKLDENLWVLLGSMLGIGGLRTIEKLKGVAR